MKRLFIISVFIIFNLFSFSQEEGDSLRVFVCNNVIEPDLVNPTTRVQMYLLIKDSIDQFIDKVQKEFGEIEDEEGVFEWKLDSLDTIGKKIKVFMYYGYSYYKGNTENFKTISPSKAHKLKAQGKKQLRIRILLKDGKDALLSQPNQLFFIRFFEDILNRPEETIIEEIEDPE